MTTIDQAQGFVASLFNNPVTLSRQSYSYAGASTFTVSDGDDNVIGSYASAYTIDISVTTLAAGFHAGHEALDTSVAALDTAVAEGETSGDDATGDGLVVPHEGRARGLASVLHSTLDRIEESGDMTGNDAKRLSKLHHAYNMAQGGHPKLGQLDGDTRNEIRFIKIELNSFFRQNGSNTLGDTGITHFMELMGQIDALRAFTLKAVELLAFLKGAPAGAAFEEAQVVEESPESGEPPEPTVDVTA